MLQRVQSIYLLLALVSSGLMLLFPLADFINGEQIDSFLYFYGVQPLDETLDVVMNTIPLAALLGGISVLVFITIFMYKNRNLQTRLCVFNMLLQVGALGLIYFYSVYLPEEIGVTSYKFSFIAIFPVITLIFLFMANKGIRKDEALIRSMDRIR